MTIPFREEPDGKTVNCFLDQKLVQIKHGGEIDVCMQYPLLKMKHAIDACYVREEVRNRLYLAQSFLPDGFRIRIWDAWRPFLLQEELYNQYSGELIKAFHITGTEEERRRLIRRYVSEPVCDWRIPPVHTTGGAIDVTLLNADGNEIDMGTEFDSFSEKTHTDYFERGSSCEIRNNRRLLYYAMTRAGFTNLPSEWWHYDFGDRFWAYYNHTAVLYCGVFTVGEKHET